MADSVLRRLMLWLAILAVGAFVAHDPASAYPAPDHLRYLSMPPHVSSHASSVVVPAKDHGCGTVAGDRHGSDANPCCGKACGSLITVAAPLLSVVPQPLRPETPSSPRLVGRDPDELRRPPR